MKRKFAIPTVDGKSCAHFGHCQSFALVEVDGADLGVMNFMDPPAHQPGTYPRFLAEFRAQVLITGNGPGGNAAAVLQATGTEIYVGAGDMTVKASYEAFKKGELTKFPG